MREAAKKGNRDVQDVRRALLTNPVSDVKEVATITGLQENRCYRILESLEKKEEVVRVKLGRAYGARFRYWLAAEGVLNVSATRRGIPWPVSETGIKRQIKRLPMLEACNDLAPRFWAHDGVDTSQWVLLDPGPFEELFKFTPELRMVRYSLMREGEIHAVATYHHGAWVAIIWVGNMHTYHNVRDKAALAIKQIGDQYQPAAWLIVGYDRLAARLGAECWPADVPVLAVSVDGFVERRMRPCAFSRPLEDQAEATRLGKPERVRWRLDKNNKNHDQAMVALNALSEYRLFRVLGEIHDPKPGQLKRGLTDSYRASVRKLKAAGLVEKSTDGRLQLTKAGRRTMAEMDRISVKDLGRRVEKYLEEGGEYRKDQLSHNTAAIDVYFALWKDNVDAFAGFRALSHFRDANGWGRVSPDLVVCLDREDDTSLMVYLEIELTARWRSGIRRKLRPYVRLQKYLGHSVPLLFVAKDETAEREVQQQAKQLGLEMLLTTTRPRLMAGSSWGYTSVWRTASEEVEGVDWLAKQADWARRLDRQVDAAFASDWEGNTDDDPAEPT